MPNSLSENIGVEGYDEEGCKRLVKSEGYYFPDWCLTLMIWCALKGLDLVSSMWDNEYTGTYNRWDPDAVEIDVERYNGADRAYRDLKQGERRRAEKKHEEVVKQEKLLFAKMLSLLDLDMVTFLQQLPNWADIWKRKRPRSLRGAVRLGVQTNAVENGEDVKDSARDEWTFFEMANMEEHLNTYYHRFKDLLVGWYQLR